MTSEELNAMQDELARTIRQQAEAALEQALQLMSEGVAPRDALSQVTQTFTGQYYEALSEAFTMVLGDYVGMADIKALNISGIDLSDALYTHLQRTNLTAQQVINDHMKGFVQARKLAMDLYEGYGFKDDPLRVKAKLPKYLRQALKDPAIDDGYRRLLSQIRINQIKTPALKAGYQQLLDGLENGAGQARLKNLLKTAWFERNRYFANRIAQTETSRAYMNGVAQELMADDQVVWVQYEMSRTHPQVDICDRHARLNAYGQGPGIYPKAQAPKPPAHPFCRCKITPRYDVEAEPGKPIKNAERSFMAGLDSRDQRLIAGSRAKLEAFSKGKTLESIYNGSAKPMYRWGRLGDRLDIKKQFRQPTGEFTPYDDGYPNTVPDTSTPLKRAVIAFEDAHRNNADFEIGAFFNDDGSFALGPKKGKPDRVSFRVVDLQRMAGKVYSHNHPMGASFSIQDVELAAEYGFAEIRAVTKFFRHSLSAAAWPAIDEIGRAVKEEERRVEAVLIDQIKTGQIRPIHYGLELTHRTWARVAMRFAMKYVREKS